MSRVLSGIALWSCVLWEHSQCFSSRTSTSLTVPSLISDLTLKTPRLVNMGTGTGMNCIFSQARRGQLQCHMTVSVPPQSRAIPHLMVDLQITEIGSIFCM